MLRVARGIQNPEQIVTPDAAGIDKNLAKRARHLASIPEQEVEHSLTAWRCTCFCRESAGEPQSSGQ